MTRRILLLTIFAILAYGFWVSPDFKTIAAGVAIFLLGMYSLEEGFKAFSGGVLENFLQKTTDTTWKSLSFGIVSTTLMQSSSLVSVITISFLSAGLIALTQGIGIIFGANLGTTTGAWLVAGLGLKIDIAAYAMPMLVFGVIMMFQKSNTKLQGAGWALIGLGFLFLGIAYMKGGFETVGAQFDLAQFAVPGFKGLLIYTGIGIAATVVMQSSHATLVLILTALAAGQITYENALALAIGANVGTCITAILGSLSANVEGKRLAVAHLIFNVATGVIAIVFISQFLWGVEHISAMVGIADDDYTLKLAVFHTLFNITGVLVMSPLIGKLASFLTTALRPPAVTTVQPKYLNGAALELPDTIMEAVRKETLHLWDNAFEIIAHGINLHRTDILSERDLKEIIDESNKPVDIDIDKKYERNVKMLYGAIVSFISEAHPHISAEYAEDLYGLRTAGRNIVEAIKDVKHLRKNLDAFMMSDNPHVMKEYELFRIRLANILRELSALRLNMDDPENVVILDLDGLKAEMREGDIVANGMLDRLIRENKITGEMATSIMNDSSYVYDISSKLIDMGMVLFAARGLELRAEEQNMALSEEELDAVVKEIEAEENTPAN